jgi:hypothetical protein
MYIILHDFGKYSSTSLPFLIQLFLLNVPDIPHAMLNISTTCTRSVWRLMQFDTCMNAAWQSLFRQICIELWPFCLWHVWHHSLKYCLYISSPTVLLLCRLTVTCRSKLNVLAVIQCNWDSRTFTWCIQPLLMYRRIIMSHHLDIEINNKLTCSKIGKQIAFHCN